MLNVAEQVSNNHSKNNNKKNQSSIISRHMHFYNTHVLSDSCRFCLRVQRAFSFLLDVLLLDKAVLPGKTSKCFLEAHWGKKKYSNQIFFLAKTRNNEYGFPYKKSSSVEKITLLMENDMEGRKKKKKTDS